MSDLTEIKKIWFKHIISGHRPVVLGMIGTCLVELGQYPDERYSILLLFDTKSNTGIDVMQGIYDDLDSALSQFDVYFLDENTIRSAFECHHGADIPKDEFHTLLCQLDNTRNFRVVPLDYTI